MIIDQLKLSLRGLLEVEGKKVKNSRADPGMRLELFASDLTPPIEKLIIPCEKIIPKMITINCMLIMGATMFFKTSLKKASSALIRKSIVKREN